MNGIQLGKPDTKDFGIKSYFIDYQIGKTPDFLENVKKNINKKNQVLVMCAAGGRSLIAANLLAKEGYDALNVSDGFSGKRRSWLEKLRITFFIDI